MRSCCARRSALSDASSALAPLGHGSAGETPASAAAAQGQRDAGKRTAGDPDEGVVAAGNMLGMLIRELGRSIGRLPRLRVAPSTVSGVLATNQEWFRDLQSWVGLNNAPSFLFSGTLTGEQWGNVAVTVPDVDSAPLAPRPPARVEVRGEVAAEHDTSAVHPGQRPRCPSSIEGL